MRQIFSVHYKWFIFCWVLSENNLDRKKIRYSFLLTLLNRHWHFDGMVAFWFEKQCWTSYKAQDSRHHKELSGSKCQQCNCWETLCQCSWPWNRSLGISLDQESESDRKSELVGPDNLHLHFADQETKRKWFPQSIHTQSPSLRAKPKFWKTQHCGCI